MGTEIFKIVASWTEKLRKTRVPFLMTPSVKSIVNDWPVQRISSHHHKTAARTIACVVLLCCAVVLVCAGVLWWCGVVVRWHRPGPWSAVSWPARPACVHTSLYTHSILCTLASRAGHEHSRRLKFHNHGEEHMKLGRGRIGSKECHPSHVLCDICVCDPISCLLSMG